ncbi:MAG: hypothetical protein K0Q95_2411 [Bacteroidota bacterium]|jgi:hypothetical protein|nr:hypothetical protein [Bacteroidota bacterium]
MKKIVFLFLLLSSFADAQEITLKKATMQTVNHGASPTSTTTYSVLVCNCKKAKWSLDSVVSISAGQPVTFYVSKVEKKDTINKKLSSFKNLGTGDYRISFSKTKQRGGGRPGAPQNTMVDTTNIEGGVVIHYSVKDKRKKLKIDSFEELETINTP